MWMFFGIVEVIFFFYFSNNLTLRWRSISESKYKKILIINAFLIRLVYILIIYIFYLKMTGDPFEFDAGDSKMYHISAKSIEELGLLPGIENQLSRGFSDSGYIIILSFLYTVFGDSILLSRILLAIFSVWSCILVYNLTKRNFGEAAGRISGILMMLVPNMIYYCGLHLKEILMVFLCTAFIERADLLIKLKRFNITLAITVFFLVFSLFFFRTVLAVAALFALISSFLLSPGNISKFKVRLLAGLWVVSLGAMFYSGTIWKEVSGYWESKETSQEQSLEFKSTRQGGNRLANYGSSAVFLPVILVAPFPTLIDIGEVSNNNLLLLNGGFFTRNVYIFFLLIALVVIIRAKTWRNHILILSFILGYLVVLANSGFALSERFHLPILPFLLSMTAYGITNINRSTTKFYIPYLLLISVIIIGWNWFKLAGRGLV
jgi:4-amino-4-deoxy-L-arabinose transferase-like glycosyltransferase